MASDEQKPGPKIENPPEAIAPGEPKATSRPAIAEKADDLEEIKKSVEDAASVSGGLWLSYLFVLSYIAIAAGAVTHEDLLLERTVKLPFLNVELPLLAFFALAPFVVLIIHVYALMHFIMLGKKASRFHNELRRQFPDSETKAIESGALSDSGHKEIRDNKRWLLPSNIFVQILAGPPELRTGFFGLMLKIIALTTLVAFPVLVLLLLQIQFLPFHDARITWVQRAALFFDIVLLWPLRPPILANLNVANSQRAQLFSRILRAFGLAVASVMSIATIWFSIMVATIPGEWRAFPLTYVAEIEPKTVNKWVFGIVDPWTGTVTGNWPSNSLRLQGFDIYEALKVDDPKKLDWKDHTFDLHSRRLEGAVFDRAKLGKVDLKGANLEGAWLRQAKLQGASLTSAQLQGASLVEAELQGASLNDAKLQGASLVLAKLQGASLNHAKLQGASLREAELQGASLFSAELQGALLNDAKLQGALLFSAELQGASLDHAQLQGASLPFAQLQGASLDGAEINAADFTSVVLWRTQWGEIDPEGLGAVRLKDATWKSIWRKSNFSDPVEWDAKAYAELRDSMKSIPEGEMREAALKRIKTLDCGNLDKTLASRDPAAKPPREVLDWQNKLARASVGDAAYAKALATELQSLVCGNDENAIYVLRRVIDQLDETNREAPRLVDFIMSKNCPVSASLTDDDKAKLLKIKQDAEQKSAPPSESKKGK